MLARYHWGTSNLNRQKTKNSCMLKHTFIGNETFVRRREGMSFGNETFVRRREGMSFGNETFVRRREGMSFGNETFVRRREGMSFLTKLVILHYIH